MERKNLRCWHKFNSRPCTDETWKTKNTWARSTSNDQASQCYLGSSKHTDSSWSILSNPDQTTWFNQKYQEPGQKPVLSYTSHHMLKNQFPNSLNWWLIRNPGQILVLKGKKILHSSISLNFSPDLGWIFNVFTLPFFDAAKRRRILVCFFFFFPSFYFFSILLCTFLTLFPSSPLSIQWLFKPQLKSIPDLIKPLSSILYF